MKPTINITTSPPVLINSHPHSISQFDVTLFSLLCQEISCASCCLCQYYPTPGVVNACIGATKRLPYWSFKCRLYIYCGQYRWHHLHATFPRKAPSCKRAWRLVKTLLISRATFFMSPVTHLWNALSLLNGKAWKSWLVCTTNSGFTTKQFRPRRYSAEQGRATTLLRICPVCFGTYVHPVLTTRDNWRVQGVLPLSRFVIANKAIPSHSRNPDKTNQNMSGTDDLPYSRVLSHISLATVFGTLGYSCDWEEYSWLHHPVSCLHSKREISNFSFLLFLRCVQT